jgi:hypothetical protein
MRTWTIDGVEYADRQEAADELTADYEALIKNGLWPKLRAELEQAFDGDPKMQAAVLRVVDEQAAQGGCGGGEAHRCASMRRGHRMIILRRTRKRLRRNTRRNLRIKRPTGQPPPAVIATPARGTRAGSSPERCCT